MPMIRFTVKKIRFEVRIGFALLVMAVSGVMLAAAFWQLQRAQEKTVWQSVYAEASQEAVIDLPDTLPDPEGLRYRQVRLAGRFWSERQFLLDNKIREGRVGYHVITPFESNGSILLVDRGWIALGDSREQLPDIRVETAIQEISGIVTTPGDGFRLGEMDVDRKWPRVIGFVDYSTIAQRLEKAVYPALIILDDNHKAAYERDWQAPETARQGLQGPEKHYSYAIQWFLMFLATMVMFFWFSIKRTNESDL